MGGQVLLQHDYDFAILNFLYWHCWLSRPCRASCLHQKACQQIRVFLVKFQSLFEFQLQILCRDACFEDIFVAVY